jgi:hypothetical protein
MMETLPSEIIAHIALIENSNISTLKETCRRFYNAIRGNYLCAERIKILTTHKKINNDIFNINSYFNCLGDHIISKDDYRVIYEHISVDSRIIKVCRIYNHISEISSTSIAVLLEVAELIGCEYDDGYYIRMEFS